MFDAYFCWFYKNGASIVLILFLYTYIIYYLAQKHGSFVICYLQKVEQLVIS